MHLQRAAAVIGDAPAFRDTGHIGFICDLLSARVDTSRWSGHEISQRLSDDTKDRGWAFPTRSQLKDPIGFLRYRLNQIDWTGPTPAEIRAARGAELRVESARRAEEIAARNAAAAPYSSPARRSAIEQFRAELAAKALNRKASS